MIKRYVYIIAITVCFSLDSGLVFANPLKITTWNLEHLMGRVLFNNWNKICKKHYYDDEAAVSAGKLSHLTYCNAGNGQKWPCPSGQESLPVHTNGALEEKYSALRKRANELNSDIYAVQEIGDKAALLEIFPSDVYNFYISEQPKVDIPMRVGYAVRKGLEAKVSTLMELAICETKEVNGEDRGYCTRPGLELNLKYMDKNISMLNVHMKAGCRSQIFDSPNLKISGKACAATGVTKEQNTLERIDYRKSSCKTYRNQIPFLESWVENKASVSPHFLILGDFNRNFFKKFGQDRDIRFPARLDDSQSMDKVVTNTKIGSLINEINDESPSGSSLWVINQKVEVTDARCHTDIDHFLLSKEWVNRLRSKGVSVLLSTGSDYDDSQYAADRVNPSDHCPLTLILN